MVKCECGCEQFEPLLITTEPPLRYGFFVETSIVDGDVWRNGKSIRNRRDLKIIFEIT